MLSVFLPTNADISSSAFSNAGSKIIIDSITYEKTRSSLTIGFNVLSDVGFTAFYMGGNVYKNPATEVTIIDCETSKSGDLIIPSSIRVNYIENPVTSIGYQAFGGCNNLTSVTIPNSITSIGTLAFRACDSLISVTIPNSVTYIPEGAFSHCTSLTSVIIPNSVTAIGYEGNYWGVFDSCINLNSVTIGNSVTTIGDWAFHECSSLTSITIPSSVTYIGASAFTCAVDGGILSNIAVVTCLASTPPRLYDSPFWHWWIWHLPQTVYVPCGSLEAYINSDWGYFFWSEPYGIRKIHEITYDIDATANNEVFGSVAVERDCPSATLTATANEGFAFLSWNDGNTDNPRIVSLSSDTAFTAYFGTTIIYDTICQGSTYEENNFNETEQGFYTQITTDANGQDSVTVLSLTVNPIYNTELTANICQGQVYTDNNFNVSEAGVYTQNLQTINGCDSIVTLTLNVNPIYNTELTASICEGQVYNENGFYVSEAGVYTQNLPTVNGCDSIVTLTLNVNPIIHTELSATICEGSAYNDNGFNVSEAGTYTQNLTTANGCDSIVTLTLNINSVLYTSLTETICEGQTYTDNGFNVSEAGVYTQNLTSVNGCDSIVTLNLSVNPIYNTDLVASICDGEVYNENGFNVNEAGVYSQTLQALNGCDSIVTLTLSVNPIFNTNLSAFICEGQTYTENGFNVSEAGVYTQSLQSVSGCDSIVTLTLNVNPIIHTELSATICEGSVYNENGFNVSEAGTYTQNLTTANGCDSIVTLTLNINSVRYTSLIETICEGQVYTDNNFNVSEAGVYTQNLTSVNGCDSIVTLTLNVNPIYNTELTATICQGQVYTENNFNVSEAGVYTQNLQTINGCDSIVTLTLNVNPIFNTELTATICEGSVYTENNFNVSEAGVYTQNLQTINGCDSIVTLTLNVNPIYNTELTATICEGQVYTENNFNVNEAGVYTQNLQTVNGCDSIVTLTLNVNPIYNTELSATICQGQAYTENGFNVNEAGVYTQNLQTINGCDSIVTLTLSVNPIFNTNLSAFICEGETYTENGFNVSEAGVYTQSLQSVSGCDSIVTLTLNVNPIFHTELSATICEGSVYNDNGFNVSEAGTYTQNLTTANGCDSIVTLTLNVQPSYNTNLTATICEGSELNISGFNVSEAGVYTQTYTAVNGCDSIVTLTVTELPIIHTDLTLTICEGTSLNFSGFNVSEAGIYTQNLTSVNGCDSIVTLTVSVNPVFDTTINATINTGETYAEFGFNESESGTYVQNLQTVNGCDSTITLNLTVNSSLYDVAELTEITFYPNPTSGKVTFNQAIEKIEVIDNIGKIVMRFFDTSEINIDVLPAGAYYLRMTIGDKTIMRKVIKE